MFKNIFKKFLPFITMGSFMLIANLLLVLGVYQLRNIETSTLAVINFGIAIMSLFGMFTEAYSKQLTIHLSKTNSSEFKKILFTSYVKVTPYMLFVFALAFGILMLIYPEHLILILSILSLALLLYIYHYFRAWINGLEKYFILGLLTLAFPTSRVISGYLVSHGANYLTVFWALIIAAFTLLIGSILYLKSKNKDLLKPVNTTKFSIDPKLLLFNAVLQLAVNTFWIFDGIILNKTLSASIYTSYITFAFLYKFPLFISTSFLFVILGENISSKKEQKNFIWTIVRGMLLVVAVFIPIIVFEYFKTGYIHYLIGYGKYYVDGISIFFGLGWMLQTLSYLLFSSSLKLAPKSKLVLAEIVISSLTFIIGLTVFNETLKVLTLFILFHGLITLAVSTIMLIQVVKRPQR
ncbi:MAG: hypothetical protein ABIC57_01615 [bacterium]